VLSLRLLMMIFASLGAVALARAVHQAWGGGEDG